MIANRLGLGDPKCSRCGEGDESIEHMLFYYCESAIIWELAPLQWDGFVEEKR